MIVKVNNGWLESVNIFSLRDYKFYKVTYKTLSRSFSADKNFNYDLLHLDLQYIITTLTTQMGLIECIQSDKNFDITKSGWYNKTCGEVIIEASNKELKC